jgi:hypothetical protein
MPLISKSAISSRFQVPIPVSLSGVIIATRSRPVFVTSFAVAYSILYAIAVDQDRNAARAPQRFSYP